MSSQVNRSDLDLLDETQRLLQEHNNENDFLNACKDNAVMSTGSGRRVGKADRREHGERDAEAPPAPHNSSAGWPLFTAEMISRISAPLQEKMLDERRPMQYVAQWCGTPMQQVPGCAYEDICVRYDEEPERHVRLVTPSPDQNIYVRIPRSLRFSAEDPVLSAANVRLQKFLRETFWCNIDFYKCCMAAIALAKRGLNIDRCFIGESPGGAGQSLYSSHIAAVYARNHAFVDPNLFHNEEEMRKQLGNSLTVL